MTEQSAPPPHPQPGPPPHPPAPQGGAPTPPPAGQWGTPGQPGMGPAPDGMGQAPHQEGMGQAPQQAPQKPSKAKGIVKQIVGAVVAIAVLAVGGWIFRNLTGDPSTANVGDCMEAGSSAEDISTVKCDDAKAKYKVVGRIEGKTESEFNASANPCTAYPTAESAFWSGKRNRSGYILCLEPVKK